MLAQVDFLFQAIRQKRTYMPMHRHSCYELVYYSSGSGFTRLDTMEYRYEPNTYTIVPPGMPHDERRHEDTDVIFIGFSPFGRELPPLQPGLFPDAPDARILRLLHSMRAEMQDKQSFYAQKLNLRMSEVAIEHLRATTTSDQSRADDSLLYARTFIDENYNQKLSIEELANMSGYSYHHFRHLFRRRFGASPIRYLMDKRLERARSLLRHTNLSVTAVAMECGFSNDAQFCTIFKRELGATPRAYRHHGARGSFASLLPNGAVNDANRPEQSGQD